MVFHTLRIHIFVETVPVQGRLTHLATSSPMLIYERIHVIHSADICDELKSHNLKKSIYVFNFGHLFDVFYKFYLNKYSSLVLHSI